MPISGSRRSSGQPQICSAATWTPPRRLHAGPLRRVGYRVRSPRGTQFRQWATARLGELLVKGFTLDDERIKAGRTLGDDYFEELLSRIRDIRSSERMFLPR